MLESLFSIRENRVQEQKILLVTIVDIELQLIRHMIDRTKCMVL